MSLKIECPTCQQHIELIPAGPPARLGFWLALAVAAFIVGFSVPAKRGQRRLFPEITHCAVFMDRGDLEVLSNRLEAIHIPTDAVAVLDAQFPQQEDFKKGLGQLNERMDALALRVCTEQRVAFGSRFALALDIQERACMDAGLTVSERIHYLTLAGERERDILNAMEYAQMDAQSRLKMELAARLGASANEMRKRIGER
jgi:hypothetical protein